MNKSDPTGLVNLSYTEGSQWESSFNPTDRFTIIGHGNSTNGLVVNHKIIGPTQIARDALEKGYKPGTPIQLIICESGVGGKESLASKVANAMEKLTKVPTETSGPTGKCQSPTARGAEPEVQNDSKGQPGKFEKFTSGAATKETKKEK